MEYFNLTVNTIRTPDLKYTTLYWIYFPKLFIPTEVFNEIYRENGIMDFYRPGSKILEMMYIDDYILRKLYRENKLGDILPNGDRGKEIHERVLERMDQFLTTCIEETGMIILNGVSWSCFLDKTYLNRGMRKYLTDNQFRKWILERKEEPISEVFVKSKPGIISFGCKNPVTNYKISLPGDFLIKWLDEYRDPASRFIRAGIMNAGIEAKKTIKLNDYIEQCYKKN